MWVRGVEILRGCRGFKGFCDDVRCVRPLKQEWYAFKFSYV